MVMANGFNELNVNEMMEVDGGLAFLAIPLIEIAKWGITITVGHCLAAGSAVGVGVVVVGAVVVIDKAADALFN